MNEPFDDHDELELTPDQIEALLDLYREQLGADVDVALLQAVARNAVSARPEREQLLELLAHGAHLFVRSEGPDIADDDFELITGFFDDPGLNPPGAPPGKTWPLGRIPLSSVRRPHQG